MVGEYTDTYSAPNLCRLDLFVPILAFVYFFLAFGFWFLAFFFEWVVGKGKG